MPYDVKARTEDAAAANAGRIIVRTQELIHNGVSEKEAVQQAIIQMGGNAAELAAAADQNRVVEAGEHIAKSNEAIDAANKKKDGKTDLPEEQKLDPGNRKNDRELSRVKASRDAATHPEQNIPAELKPGEYQNAATQATKELAARASTLESRAAETGGKKLADYRTPNVEKAAAEMRVAANVMKPLRNGPTKGSELTLADLQRAEHMHEIGAVSNAKAHVDQVTYNNADKDLQDLELKRNGVCHDFSRHKNGPGQGGGGGKGIGDGQASENRPAANDPQIPHANEPAIPGVTAAEAEATGSRSAGGVRGGIIVGAVVAGATLVSELAQGKPTMEALNNAEDAAIPGSAGVKLAANGKIKEGADSVAGDVASVVGGVVGAGICGAAFIETGPGALVAGAACAEGGSRIFRNGYEAIRAEIAAHMSGEVQTVNKDPMQVTPSNVPATPAQPAAAQRQ